MSGRNGARGTFAFDTVTLEGGLFSADLLEKICAGDAPFQSRDDYAIPKGIQISGEYGRAFHIAKAQWADFKDAFGADDTRAVTVNFLKSFLRDVMGFSGISELRSPILISESSYPITLAIDGKIPVVAAPHNIGIDESSRDFSSGGRKKTAFQLAQEFLNASGKAEWGVVANGRAIRLVRSSDFLTRPRFIEFDLERILNEDRYPDFKAVWYMFHHSRSRLRDGFDIPIWEEWVKLGVEKGSRVRERLRYGVGNALLALGNGFVSHMDNVALRNNLSGGEMPVHDFYRELLRLIYRMLFVITLEERNLLHEGAESTKAVQIYASGYSFRRLRDRSLKTSESAIYSDLWHSMRIVFRGLASGEQLLALPPLGGLFASDQCPALDNCSISNRSLMFAMRNLRWADMDSVLTPVDYRNMGPEEIGSVYESLLEFEPMVNLGADAGARFRLPGLAADSAVAGNQRKTTGSYYTPESLVNELIKSALDPVLERVIRENPGNPAAALLKVSVIDPACGSGHFLLAAARRIAESVASKRRMESGGDAVKPEDYRSALRDVVRDCIYGVDLNPLAVELAKFTLWLEGYAPGRPLTFIDHQIKCGNSLIGILRPEQLLDGIPQTAFDPLSGDDSTFCSELKRENKSGLKRLRELRDGGQRMIIDENARKNLLMFDRKISSMPDGKLDEVEVKKREYEAVGKIKRETPHGSAADVYVGAFLRSKNAADAYVNAFMSAKGDRAGLVPTSATLSEIFSDFASEPHHEEKIMSSRETCLSGNVFHWFIEFPDIILDRGGFDCVLGNPPWEVSQLSEVEYFASRAPEIATLTGNARKKAITALEQINPKIWNEYIIDKRKFESSNQFFRSVDRFSLTAFRKLNTYALFAETMYRITAPNGRAGFIVPTGIATDDSTKHFFAHLVENEKLASLYDFENRRKFFPEIDSRIKFCLMTTGASETADFSFFMTDTKQLAERERHFSLTATDFESINPNTKTCQIFRSGMDAEITRKIYSRAPVLIRDVTDDKPEYNPWGITLRQGLFNMTSSSHLFKTDGEIRDGVSYLPLYEAKMIHQFDHRWASYAPGGDGKQRCVEVPLEWKKSANRDITPCYWVDELEVLKRLARVKNIDCDNEDEEENREKLIELLDEECPQWLMGWRDICRSTDERTVIATVLPRAGVGNNLPLMISTKNVYARMFASLLANLCSIVCDFIAKQKIGGMHANFFVFKQLPVLPPDSYTQSDMDFITPRVLELTYTSNDMRPWAEDICPEYGGGPFAFDPDRRALLRAELDARYAKLYGLTRNELRYILDPSDVMGPDYPSETFRVLKDKEIGLYGEYKTRRLTIEAWDRLGY